MIKEFFEPDILYENPTEQFPEEIRKKRCKINEEIIKKIKIRSEKGGSARDISKALDISEPAVRKWARLISCSNSLEDVINLIQKPGPRSNTSFLKLRSLAECVQEDKALTQKETAK